MPALAPRLPVAIPAVVASGIPDCGYPYPWSVRRWIEGERVDAVRLEDPVGFALAVANFVNALNGIAPGEVQAAGRTAFIAAPIRSVLQMRRPGRA